MSGFTQGKWEFWKNKKYPYWHVGKEGSERYIATVDKEANARLIAAAPDMYNLLEKLLNVLCIHDEKTCAQEIVSLLNFIDSLNQEEE